MQLFHKNKETITILDAHYYERQKAYNEALNNQRIENAKIKAKADADRLANKKPFYQKLIGIADTIGKDLIKNASNTNPNALITFDNPPREKRTRRKKQRIKKLKT